MAKLDGKQIAILVHNFFEQIEYTSPREALEAEGATVHLVSTKDKGAELTGMNTTDHGDSFTAEVSIEEIKSTDYHAIVVPGGVINSDFLRMEEKAQNWIRDFNTDGKPMAVICHGPWLLVSAGLANNRQLTSYYTLEHDLKNAGANWVDEPVVVDGNLITSRNPGDLDAFNEALITKLVTPGS